MCEEKHYGPKGFAGCYNFGPHEITKMKRMARHFMHGFMGSYIPFNIEDLGDSYLITVPLAGRTKEEVKVSLINKHLNIKAEKPKIPERENLKEKPEEKDSNQDWCMPFFRKGFSFIDVDMDITLPSDADTETLVSKMSNGLLKITMAKKPAKKIDISEN
ncbi:MAG: Hsp20/alpha crystallin family protein [Candidatus Odinarchaeota archaeon]